MGDSGIRSHGATPSASGDDRLESWKEIAAYLRRDVTTVQRWEKRDGLPVHRLAHDKLGSIFAFKSELDAWSIRSTISGAIPRTRGAGTRGRRLVAVIIGVSATLGISAVGLWLQRRAAATSSESQQVTRTVLELPKASELGVPAISPDGRYVVYPTTTDRLDGQLYIRSLAEFEARPLPETRGATVPFFSPDGQWIGFFANGELRRVSRHGGAPVTIAPAPDGRGASWGSDGTIVFAPHYLGGLMRVPAAGGTVQILTRTGSGEKTHRAPHFVPNSSIVIFTTGTAEIESFDDARLEAVRVDTGERRVLLGGGTDGRYVPQHRTDTSAGDREPRWLASRGPSEGSDFRQRNPRLRQGRGMGANQPACADRSCRYGPHRASASLVDGGATAVA
jgi:hypothetical protein